MATINNLNQTMQGAGGGTDQAGNIIKGNGIMTPVVQLTANGTAAIGNQDLLLAYNIDVYNDIKYYKSERFPLLTADLNTIDKAIATVDKARSGPGCFNAEPFHFCNQQPEQHL